MPPGIPGFQAVRRSGGRTSATAAWPAPPLDRAGAAGAVAASSSRGAPLGRQPAPHRTSAHAASCRPRPVREIIEERPHEPSWPLRPDLALPRRGEAHAPHAGQRGRADGSSGPLGGGGRRLHGRDAGHPSGVREDAALPEGGAPPRPRAPQRGPGRGGGLLRRPGGRVPRRLRVPLQARPGPRPAAALLRAADRAHGGPAAAGHDLGQALLHPRAATARWCPRSAATRCRWG